MELARTAKESGTTSPTETDLIWYVAYTRPRMEQTALENLARQNFTAYLPLWKMRRRIDGQVLAAHEPMFPRYIFVSPSSARQSFASIRSTRGLVSLVSFGGEPARVNPHLIEEIRHAEHLRNTADLDVLAAIRPGSKVRICRSGLQNLECVVTAVAKQRVTLLLQLLGGEQQVTVDVGELDLAR